MAEPNEYDEFVSQILQPTNLESLRDSSKHIVEVVIHQEDDQEELVFDDIYPFYTIGDLLLRIYMEKEELKFHPQNVCLLLANDEEDGYSHFQFSQFDGDNQPIFLINPFTRVKEDVDKRFVNEDGSYIRINSPNREDCMLETTLFNIPKETYRIHLFSYLDLLETFTDDRDKKNWNGKFRPYFPAYPQELRFNTGELSDNVITYTNQRKQRFINKSDLVNSCNNLLQTKSLKKPGNKRIGDTLSSIHFRNLRFLWKPILLNEDEYERFDLETIFYDTPVSEFIPYIRLYSTRGSPLSKIYVIGPTNMPGMNDPEVLLQWAKESSITPSEDLIMMKFMVHPGQGTISPLYGTFFVFDSGHAKMILQPNEGQKLLSPQIDFLQLSHVMTTLMNSIPKLQPKVDGLESLPLFKPSNVSLDDAYIILSLTLDDSEPKMKATHISKILPFFQPFFQITSSPLVEQKPIAYLRFKLVDNFRTPSRDFQFLRRMVDIQKGKGISMTNFLIKEYEEEFNVSHDIAVDRVGKFLDDQTNLHKIVIDPLETDYVQAKNPGLDIAIFEKHPLYTFHAYRIDSLRALVQIKTLLSLLISTTPSDFGKGDAEAAKDEEEEDLAEQEEANNDASFDMEGSFQSATLNAKVTHVVSQRKPLGDLFDDFGDEPPAQEPLITEEEEKLPTRDELLGEEENFEENIKKEKKVKKSKKKKGEDDDEDENDEEFKGAVDLKKIPVTRYFLTRLKQQDMKLFDLKAEGFSPYPRKCPAQDRRQPISITEEDYKRMKQIYKEDIDKHYVQFIDFPFSEGQKFPIKPPTNTEVISTLRYGTKLPIGQANIYICSEYWCKNDEIIVLKKDFEADTDRNGNYKEKNTCPFCKKGLIKHDKRAKSDEAVIGRTKNNKKHLVVNFLKENTHPNGFGVPCCFIKQGDTPIYDTDPFFTEPFKKKQNRFFTSQQPPLTDKPSNVINLLREGEKENTMPVDYEEQLQDIRTAYIVEANKFPLGIYKKNTIDKITKKEVTKYISQVGILPVPVEKYFSQSAIPQLVRQEHANWKIITDHETKQASVSGFLRVGVKNMSTNHSESFMDALAPYFYKKSSNEMKQLLLEFITPNHFLGLNYGNFLFDFYTPSIEKPTDKKLQDWVKDHFKLLIETGEHKESFLRLYKAYHSFLDSLDLNQIYKEYRQYAHTIAQNNMFLRGERTNGLLVIVLEVDKSSVQIRCPPYGVSQHMMDTCDISFITYYPESKIWEPVFYTNNNVEEDVHENLFYFTIETKESWPPIVQQRVQEYFTMCKTSGLGVYTEIPNVNSDSLIPLTLATKLAPVYGLMRDINNHVSNIVYLIDKSNVVVVPVIDDGKLYYDIPPIFDWNDIYEIVADSKTTRAFYESVIYPVTKANSLWQNSYTITEVVRLNNHLLLDSDGYAFHLANTFFIPIKAPEKGEVIEEYTRAKNLPWMIDRETVFAEFKPTLQESLNSKELNEIYQHLRLTFSNWLSNEESSLKKELEDVIENQNIPLYEKRQALRIKLEKTISSWLEPTAEYNQRKPSVKRVDCRLKSEEDCTNRCVWKEEGRCALHVPEETQLGHTNVKAIPFLIHRLLEELIRFPMKRDELLLQKVSKYQSLTDAFRSGNEYIIPEHTPAWTELLRMDWRMKGSENPKHYEEFSTFEPKEVIQKSNEALAPIEELFPKKIAQPSKKPIVQPTLITQPTQFTMPPQDTTTKVYSVPKFLSFFLGNKSKTLFFHRTLSVLEILCYFGLNLFEFTETFSVTEEIPLLQTKEQIEYVAKELQLSIFQIMFEKDNPLKPKLLIVEANTSGGVEPSAPALVFIQTPDEELGALSSDVSKPVAIPISQLPDSLKLRLKYATKITLS